MTRRFAAVLALIAFPATSPAALIPFNFTAKVSNIGPGALPVGYEGLTAGMAYSFSFTLDTSVADSNVSFAFGTYVNAAKDVTLRIPALGINTNLGNATFSVADGVTPSQPDILRIDAPVTSAATLLFWLRVFDPANPAGPSILTSDDLPTSIDPTQFTHTNTIGMYVPSGQQPTIFTGAAVAVPEPTAAAALPLAGAMLMRRRRRV